MSVSLRILTVVLRSIIRGRLRPPDLALHGKWFTARRLNPGLRRRDASERLKSGQGRAWLDLLEAPGSA